MVPLWYLHFPLLKLHCHKLKEKIIIKLVRMDTYIDFNDSYIFLTATYIFFISSRRYHCFVKATHAKFSPFPPAISLSKTYAK